MADSRRFGLTSLMQSAPLTFVATVGKIARKCDQTDRVRVKQLLDETNLDRYTTAEQISLGTLIHFLCAASHLRQSNNVPDMLPHLFRCAG